MTVPGLGSKADLDRFVRIPEERARRYRELGYWTDAVLPDILDRWTADGHGDRLALRQAHQAMSYGDLAAASKGIALRLRARGIGHGDRVLTQLPNRWEFIALLFGLWRIGAVPVMALAAYGRHELNHILDASGARAMAIPSRLDRSDYLASGRELRRAHGLTELIVIGAGPEELGPGEIAFEHLAQPIQRVESDGLRDVRPSPDDLAMFLMSGGTTGLPKLIPRTHADYFYNIRVSAEITQVDTTTVYLAALPIAHNFALGCPGVLGVLWRGGEVVLLPTPSVNAPAVMDSAGVTMTSAVPGLAAQWVEAAELYTWRPATLRLLQVGGARLHPSTAKRLRRVLGCGLQQVYGMAEGLLNFTRLDDDEDLVIETQGRPASPGDEIRVLDQGRREVQIGEIGELWVRGPYTIAGYFGNAAVNQDSFDENGYYRTGDLVRRLASGHLIVEGRVKDVINRGGEKISPAELEALVLTHPAVRQVAVVPVPDKVWGEAVCVYAVADPGSVTLRELRAFLAASGIARFKLPDRLLLVPALPVTAVGKVDKRELRRVGAIQTDD